MKLFLILAIISLLSACSLGISIDSSIGSSIDSSKRNADNENSNKKPSSYVVFGQHYRVLSSSKAYVKRGIASWYGKKFHGRKTSSGETYDMFAMTAAHKTLPFATKVSVKNLSNGKTLIVKINDRGPFVGDRLIDLSYVAAKKLGIIAKGTAEVEIRALNPSNTPPAVRLIPLRGIDTPESDFYIQVGAFASKINAQKLIQQLQQEHYKDLLLYPITFDKRQLYLVRLGPYALIDKANRMLQLLQQKQPQQARLIVEN